MEKVIIYFAVRPLRPFPSHPTRSLLAVSITGGSSLLLRSSPTSLTFPTRLLLFCQAPSCIPGATFSLQFLSLLFSHCVNQIFSYQCSNFFNVRRKCDSLAFQKFNVSLNVSTTCDLAVPVIWNELYRKRGSRIQLTKVKCRLGESLLPQVESFL